MRSCSPYAILFTVKYKNYLGALPARQAAYKGLTESGVSILTSVAILAGCCLSVSLITSNRIVSEITMLIARGAIISGILVLVLLPALLIMFTPTRARKRSTLNRFETGQKRPPQIAAVIFFAFC